MVRLDSATLLTIAIVFLGTLIRSSLGFGEALIAVPLLALFMPVEQAAPVAVLVSIAIAAFILLQDWRKVHFRSAGLLVFSTLFGVPLGLLLLSKLPGPVVKAILALVIIAFSVYTLFNRQKYKLEDDRLAWVFGFFAGILGGAYGMNGPPLALYGSLRRWRPDHFRATLQAYFLPASLAGMIAYALAGLWTSKVTHLGLVSLPGIALAVPLGRAINGRIHPERFASYVYVSLMVIGGVLLYQAFAKTPVAP